MREVLSTVGRLPATVRGMAALLATSALWGLVIIGPDLVPGASASALVGGRFVVLGLVSVVAARGRVRGRAWGRALAYAFAGLVGYYLLLVWAIQLTGAAPVAVVIGLTPVLYALVGARHDGLSARALAAPLAVVLTGVLLSHAVDLGRTPARDLPALAAGLGIALAAALLWMAYALANGRHLRESGISASSWTNTVGMAAGVLGAPMLVHGVATGGVGPDVGRWAVVVVVLGAGSAWLGTVAWNAAQSLLPESLVGPLLVVEILVGLGYAHAVAGHLPAPVTAVGYLLLVVGGAVAIHAVERQRLLARHHPA